MKIMLVQSAQFSSSWQVTSLIRERARFQTAHSIVADPAVAEAILFVNMPDQDYFVELRNHPLLHRYPEKAVVYCDKDLALPLWPGLYTSLSHRVGPPGWFRGAPYICPCEPRNDPEAGAQDLLFSFMGSSTSPVRKVLYHLHKNRKDIVIEDTGAYRHWDDAQSRTEKDYWQGRYREISLRSRFVLCPRGAGLGSVRLFETMQMGRAPVIISDAWTAPAGPDWPQFAIRVPETQIWRLPRLLACHEGRHAEMGRLARRAWEQHFAPDAQFQWLVKEITEMKAACGDPRRWRAIIARDRLSRTVSSPIRNTLKSIAHVMGADKKLHVKR